MNYGAFGGIAAYEMTHAFHSYGRKYTKHGTLEEWRTNGTSKVFDERKDCIAEPYSSKNSPEFIEQRPQTADVVWLSFLHRIFYR